MGVSRVAGILGSEGSMMEFKISIDVLRAEYEERKRLLDREAEVVAGLDNDFREAREVYEQARENAMKRVERMHSEVLEVEKAMEVLDGLGEG